MAASHSCGENSLRRAPVDVFSPLGFLFLFLWWLREVGASGFFCEPLWGHKAIFVRVIVLVCYQHLPAGCVLSCCLTVLLKLWSSSGARSLYRSLPSILLLSGGATTAGRSSGISTPRPSPGSLVDPFPLSFLFFVLGNYYYGFISEFVDLCYVFLHELAFSLVYHWCLDFQLSV